MPNLLMNGDARCIDKANLAYEKIGDGYVGPSRIRVEPGPWE